MKDSVWALVISLFLLYPLSLSLSHKKHTGTSYCVFYTRKTQRDICQREWKWDLRIIFFFFCGWWNFVQVLVMLFHSFLELLLFAYSLRLTLMEAQESCGRTWQVQDFVGAASCCWNLRERERQARSLSLPLSLHHNSQGGLIS